MKPASGAVPDLPGPAGGVGLATAGALDAAWRRRLRQLGQVLGAQAVVQALGFVVGLLWVRALDPSAYALFTLAFSLAATCGALADAGLSSAVMAQAGRQGAAHQRFAVWAAARALQRPLWRWGPWLALPVMAWLLWTPASAESGTGALGPVVAAMLALAFAALQLHNGPSQMLMRLAGDVAWQQRLDLLLAGLRLLATLVLIGGLGLLALEPASPVGAWAGLLVHVVAAVVLAHALGHWLHARGLDPAAAATQAPAHRRALLAQMLQQGPNAVWFVVASQASLWLVAALGSSQQVAEVGALSRLAGLFVMVGALVAVLAQPHFARRHDRAALWRSFLALQGAFALLTVVLMALAVAAPGPVLKVLGPAYAGMSEELRWMTLAASLAAWSGAVYALGCARGWVLPLPWAVACSLAGAALAAWCFDLGTVRGAFALNAFGAGLSLVAASALVARRILR